MRPARAVLLGLLGLLLAAAFAMGALALVRGGLDEPSDVDDFPALVPTVTGGPTSPSADPSAVTSPGEDDDQETPSAPSTSPSPTRTGVDDRGGDDERDGPSDDD